MVEDLQEAAAAEGCEAVSSGGVTGAAVDDVDVVPADEFRSEGGVDLRVRVFDAAQRFVREDDAEAEGVVGALRSQTVMSLVGSRRLRRAAA